MDMAAIGLSVSECLTSAGLQIDGVRCLETIEPEIADRVAQAKDILEQANRVDLGGITPQQSAMYHPGLVDQDSARAFINPLVSEAFGGTVAFEQGDQTAMKLVPERVLSTRQLIQTLALLLPDVADDPSKSKLLLAATSEYFSLISRQEIELFLAYTTIDECRALVDILGWLSGHSETDRIGVSSLEYVYALSLFQNIVDKSDREELIEIVPRALSTKVHGLIAASNEHPISEMPTCLAEFEESEFLSVDDNYQAFRLRDRAVNAVRIVANITDEVDEESLKLYLDDLDVTPVEALYIYSFAQGGAGGGAQNVISNWFNSTRYQNLARIYHFYHEKIETFLISQRSSKMYSAIDLSLFRLCMKSLNSEWAEWC